MKRKLLFLITIVSFSVSENVFSQQQNAIYSSVCVHSNAYYEYLPAGYPAPGVKYPVMLFFHGSGEVGPGTSASLPTVLRNGPPQLIDNKTFPTSFTVGGKTYSFIVISPQFTEWPNAVDVQSEIDYVKSNYNVDINRIYLTGLSMGGGVVWDYVGSDLSRGNQIAAILPVCGAQYAYQSYCNTMASENLPVWATANSMDNTVPPSYTIDHVNLINTSPVPPTPLAKLTIFPVSVPTHDAWTATYDPSFKENGMNVYEWMLQYHRNLTVLPITGLEFNAVENSVSKNIRLTWKTYTEVNVSGFNILRSTDGNTFTSVGFISSTATNGQGADYTFTDSKPLVGKNYYRLEIKDKDGNKTYSDIKIAQLAISGNKITIYPVPANDILNVKSLEVLQNAVLSIYNSQGQVVIKKSVSGSGNFTLNIMNLPGGIYYLEILNNNIKQRFSFFKK
jgi:hypothetical protein